MKIFKLAILTALVSILASCSAGNDPKLVGVWVTDSPISPVSVVTFNEKTCSIKETLFEKTTQLQYKTDTKEGTISYYKMEDNIETAKPVSSQKYSVAGFTLQFGTGGQVVFQSSS